MTPSMRAAASKTIAAALALSLCLTGPAIAGGVSVDAGALQVRGTSTGFGVIPLGSITVPLQSGPSAFNNSASLVQIDPAAVPGAAQTAVAQPGAQALAARPVIDILNQMQSKGIALPTTLKGQQDADEWIAAAQVLPDGSAKANILNMAAAVAGGPAGVGMGPGLEKAYDGAQKSAETSAPTFWQKVAAHPWTPIFLKKRLQKKAPETPAKPAAELMPVDHLAVPVDKARYTPDVAQLPSSTREVPLSGVEIVGQDKALKSIRAGLEMPGPYYNLYISGADGSGRETALKSILAELAPKMAASPDLVAVTNFADPENPLFLKLGAGQAVQFAAAVKEFVRTYQAALPEALESEQGKELKRAVNAELNKSAAEREAKFDADVANVRVGKFGIKIRPEAAGDGEHFNFAVALKYAEPNPELKKELGVIQEEIAKIKVKGFGVSVDDAGNVALTREADGKMVPVDMADPASAGDMTEEIMQELLQAVMPLAQKLGEIRSKEVFKTVSSEDELQSLIKSGVFTQEEWNAALSAAAAAAEPYKDEYRSVINQNRAEKMLAYHKMYQQIAKSVVTQIGKKVVGALMPNRHDTPEHRAWDKSAQERQDAIIVETSAIKVHGFGIVMNQQTLAKGGFGLAHVVDGEMVPMSPEEIAQAQASGELTQAVMDDLLKAVKPIMAKLAALSKVLQEEHKALHAKDPAPTDDEKKAVAYGNALLSRAVADYDSFLGAHDESLIGRQDPLEHYRVAVVRANNPAQGARVIFEDKPTLTRLFGIVEPNHDTRIINGVAIKTMSPGGPTVKSGSALQADVLVMNVMDLLHQPGAFHAVMELVRTGQAELPEEQGMFGIAQMSGTHHFAHRPKIVFVGSPYIKMLLQHYEEDFQRGFNASAEFVQELDINSDSIAAYVQFMKKMAVKSAGLIMDFNRDAIGAVLEYASWEAESNEKFTAQFGSVFNLMREASKLAKDAGRKAVTREDVQTALSNRKDGTSQHQKHYMELLEKRVFVVDVDGMKYGQANGLVVMGDFGAPARVTFVKSDSDKGGVVSNDQSAHWTGKSMDKAFANVQGYFEGKYGKKVARILKRYSFEQTYGGLDGDSATGIKTSLGELSMAGLPIRQDGAMTGSMDQLGNIQAIGGVNYKVEGLFDLLGHFGKLVPKENPRERAFAIVPRSNVSQLTLKPEIIQAIREKRFVIWAVDRVEQAQEILSYAPAAEIARRVKAYAEHEELMEAAKIGVMKKYAEDMPALKAALAKLEAQDEAWQAEMKKEAEGYRAAALTPKS